MAGTACFGLYCIFMLAFIGLIFASFWRLFEKAGRPGWEGIIPIYNMYILTCEICKMEILWFILWLVPVANLVAVVMIYMELCKKFGKEPIWVVGLVVLPFVFLPMLAFGDARYIGGKRKRYQQDEDYDDYEEERYREREDYDDYDDRRRVRDEYDDEDDDDRPRRKR